MSNKINLNELLISKNFQHEIFDNFQKILGYNFFLKIFSQKTNLQKKLQLQQKRNQHAVEKWGEKTPSTDSPNKVRR